MTLYRLRPHVLPRTWPDRLKDAASSTFAFAVLIMMFVVIIYETLLAMAAQ
jgi:hypothetical protein